MWPDRVSNPGPLTYESGALTIALCSLASKTIPKNLDPSHKTYLDFWDRLGRVKLVL